MHGALHLDILIYCHEKGIHETKAEFPNKPTKSSKCNHFQFLV